VEGAHMSGARDLPGRASPCGAALRRKGFFRYLGGLRHVRSLRRLRTLNRSLCPTL